jgi:hypothetical protein
MSSLIFAKIVSKCRIVTNILEQYNFGNNTLGKYFLLCIVECKLHKIWPQNIQLQSDTPSIPGLDICSNAIPSGKFREKNKCPKLVFCDADKAKRVGRFIKCFFNPNNVFLSNQTAVAIKFA